jgi:uncharacterized protein
MLSIDYTPNNSHWEGPYHSKYKFKRDIFQKIWDWNKQKIMTFIVGPRRMGKSVILTQMIDDLINKQKVKPKQILFWECKTSQDTKFLEDMIFQFIKTVADRNERIYILLDEIQFIFDWENTIKFIYDLDSDIKFIITGSVSLSYKRKMEESLAGRFIPFDIYPLSFNEYLILSKNKKILDSITNFKKGKYDLPEDEVNKEFIKFLKSGRYPGAVDFDEYGLNNYIQSVVNQSLNQDSITYFDIEKPNILINIFEYLRLNSGSEIVYSKLSQIVGVSTITVTKYIDVLELLGLIYIVLNRKNPLKTNTATKKIYINSAFDNSFSFSNPDRIGQLVESYVYERLSLENFGRFNSISYYRERNNEIDFINYQQNMGIEVKYRNKIDPSDIYKFIQLCKQKNVKPLLITKSSLPIDIVIDYQLACLL